MSRLSASVSVFSLLAFAFVAVSAQMGQPAPPFLQGAPAATIQEFHNLLASSGSMTDQQIDDAVSAWVEKQTSEIQAKYKSFKEEMKQHMKEADAAHQNAVQKFSPEAKAADEKLAKIAQDPSLTAEAKGKQIEEIVNSLPVSVRTELDKAMQGR